MKLGLNGFLVPVPGSLVRYLAGRESARWGRKNARLSPLQATVRRLAVQHLPASEGPLTAEAIAELGGLPGPDVAVALGELHRKLGFLALDGDGAVAWAYPVTLDNTPHHLTFESGERMSGA